MSLLLAPLSWLYTFGLYIHQNIRKRLTYRAQVPVISVGNILVGGTGKTPLVHMLVRLISQQNIQVAIVMRSAGGWQHTPYKVNGYDPANRVGDEAKMMFDAVDDLPVSVWCGRNKKAMVKRAITAGAQLVLIDDGFQRTDIERDLDIVVVPAENSFGNGKLLPAGPLREPKQALKRADFAVVMGTKKLDLPIEYVNLQPTLMPQSIKPLYNKKLLAFAGIGQPQKFFTSLENAGLDIIATVSFGDHHQYQQTDFEKLQTMAKDLKATLVTTAKDAVKLPTDMKVTVPELVLAGNGWNDLERRINALMN